MKKLTKILALLFAIAAIATGCKKLPEFQEASTSGGNVTPTPTTGTLYYRLNEYPTIGSDYISISAKYSSEGEITEMYMLVSENEDMSDIISYSTIQMNYPELSATVYKLKPNTQYYWCINYIENGTSYLTDPVWFMTLESDN